MKPSRLIDTEGRIEMRTGTRWSVVFALGIGVGLAVGCDLKPQSADKAPKVTETHSPAEAKGHDEHNHPTTGPHAGTLVELGNEEYHAEVVHDEKAGSVTIYLLDGTARKPVAIDASEVVINLKHDGKGEQFKLAAAPQAEDKAGTSSRFKSDDKELSEDLDAHGAEARLAVDIAGKSYSGAVTHDHHDHGTAKGHGHSHK